MKDSDDQLSCWTLKLQHYSFNIFYCAGAIHQNADGLSRLPVLAYMALEEDWAFYLIGLYHLRHIKPDTIQAILNSISSDSNIKDGLL